VNDHQAEDPTIGTLEGGDRVDYIPPEGRRKVDNEDRPA